MKTGKFDSQTLTTVNAVNSDQKFPIADANGVITLVSLEVLKKAVAGGLNLNAIEDGIFIMYHRNSDN